MTTIETVLTKEEVIILLINSYPHYNIWTKLIESGYGHFTNKEFIWKDFWELNKIGIDKLLAIYEMCKNSH